MRYAASILLILLLIATSIQPTAYSQDHYRFEYELSILATALNYLVESNYTGFEYYMTWYNRLDPPHRLKAIHNQAATVLSNIAGDLQRLSRNSTCLDAYFVENITSDLLQSWIYFKEQILPAYIAIGLSYVEDMGLYFLARKNLTQSLGTLDAEISLVITEAVASIKTCGEVETVELEVVPEIVKAGSRFTVVIASDGSYEGSLRVYVSNFLVELIHVNGEHELNLQAPIYEDLWKAVRRDIEFSKIASLLIEFSGTRLDDGEPVYGYATGYILFERPGITIICGERVNYGEDAPVYIFNHEDVSFNATIVLDGVAKDTIVLVPGITKVLVDNSLLTMPGAHTFTLSVNGTGSFISSTVQCTFYVEDPIKSAAISFTPIVLVDVTKLGIYGYINSTVNESKGKIILYVDGNPIAIVKDSGGILSEAIEPPGYILPTVSTVALVYEYMGYKRVIAQDDVIIINPIILLAVALGITVMAPGIGAPLEAGFKAIVNSIVEAMRSRRRMRLRGPAEVFYAVVEKLSRYTPPPIPSETLREYLVRLRRRLPERILSLVEEFVLLYERLLYSSNADHGRANIRKLRQLANKLRRLL